MAITFVAAGSIAVGLSGADPAAPYPAGLQADDRLVLVVVNGAGTEPGAQSGFTLQIAGRSGTGTQSPGGAIYHKAATGSESGNFTVTNNTAGTCRAILLAYRGVDTTTPIDVAATEASIGAVTAYTVPGQTASVTGVTFVGFTVSNSASGTMSPPTILGTWAERVDSVADSPHTSAADFVDWSSSGASGDFDFVRSAGVRGYAAVIALRPTGGTNGTATPGVIAVTSALPSATLSGGGTSTPAAVAATLATPAVTTHAGGDTAPAAIAAPLTMPAPAGSGGGTATPNTVAITVSLPAPTASGSGDATASPDPITLTAALPAPTTGAGSTASPGVIATTVTLPATTLGAGSTASPAVIPISITLPAPAASGSGSGAASPAVITCTAGLPAATATGGGTGTPATLPLTLTFPAASAQAPATATPAVIPLTLTTPAVTTGAGGDATPGTIALLTVTPNPGISAGATVDPATIALALTLYAAIASGQPPDANPITITVQEYGHTVTVTEVGHTFTARESGHTFTAWENT